MMHVKALVVLLYATLISRCQIPEEVLSITQTASRLSFTVGDLMVLNYTLKTRFDAEVECFKGSERTTAYYVLVPGLSATLTRSIVVGDLRLRHSGIYSCVARIPGTNIVTRADWIVDVVRKPVPCSPQEACAEGESESCFRDVCACPSKGMVFYSKMGYRTCRQPGILTFKTEIEEMPKISTDFLVMSYHLITFADTVVSWSNEYVSKRQVAKIYAAEPRVIVDGKFWIAQEDFRYGSSLTVSAVVSGTDISRAVELDVPRAVTKVGDNCSSDAHCSRVSGFCINGKCSCVDKAGKAFGTSYYGKCARQCKGNADCKIIANSFCFGSLCECSSGYRSFNRTCVEKGCNNDTNCNIHEVCASGKCICAPGAIFENGSCVLARCLTNQDCFWRDTVCELGHCACRLGYKVVGGECERHRLEYCRKGEGDACRTLHSECEGKWCVCKYGYYHKVVDGVDSCVPVECSLQHPCREPGTVCSNYQCVCLTSNGTTVGKCGHGASFLQLQLQKLQPDPLATALYLCVGLGVFGLAVFIPVVILEKVKATRKEGR